MIIGDLLDQARGVVSKVAQRQTKVYDASKNKVFIAQYELSGVVEASISQRTVTRQEQGISNTYYTYYDVKEPIQLSITLLPTSSSNNFLELLAVRQNQNKGFVRIEVFENGDIVDSFRGHIMSLAETTLRTSDVNKTYTFGVVSENDVSYPIQSEVDTGEREPYTGNATTYPLGENEEISSVSLPIGR